MTSPIEPARTGEGDRSSRAGAAGWTPPAKHLSDYVRIVRDRWLVAASAFILGFGWLAWSALFATPVYESIGTIQLEDSPKGDSMLAELGVTDLGTNVDAELLVMRSQMIAAAAADRGKLYVGAEEINAYRPLEGALQQFGWKRPPCRLDVAAPALAEGAVGRSYELAVDSDGRGFEIRGRDGGVVLRSTFGADRGSVVKLDGTELSVRVADGRPAGKTFSLWLRSVDEAGTWIRQGVIAREEGQRTGMVSVGYQGSNPHLAQRAAVAVQQAYLKYKSERKSKSLDNRLEWLSGEKKRVKGELDAAEKVLDGYIKEHGAVMLPERARASFDEQGRILAQKLVLEQDLRTNEASRKDLEDAPSSDRVLFLLGQEGGDARSAALAQSLSQFELEREVLRLRFKDGADELMPVTKKIDETRRLLEERTTARKAFAIRVFDRKIEATKARLQRLDAENQRQEDRLQALPKEEREIAQRTREVDATSRAFDLLTRWEGETRIALSSASSPVAAVDRPGFPAARSKPALSRQLALGLLVGLFLGVLAAFGLDYLDRTVRTPQDLERAVGLPLYAAIPDFRTVRRRERARIKKGRGGGRLPTLSAPDSVMAETYRSLRANLKFASADHPVRSLAITSSVEQEGKTVTTCNLAVALAQGGSRVVVVDADMRRPSAHTTFDVAGAPGLVDVLSGRAAWKDVLQPIADVANLALLPAGLTPKNPGALLDTPTFRRLLTELTAAYDYVLFDVPPVLAVADAAAFFRQLDAVVLLARYRRCVADVVEGARHQIERLGGNVVGVIFNAFDARRAGRGGYGYYGYYGYYGRDEGGRRVEAEATPSGDGS